MKSLLSFSSLILCTCLFAQKEYQPKGSVINETVDGDLDGDKIPEKVIVYNILTNNDAGDIREIQVLKKINNQWTILEKSRNAILGSEEGGMMGDPYQSTIIKNGILIISHYGGSSWKWGFTDKYRFQNQHFELIGTSSEGGKLEMYWQTTDINLSTGKIFYKKEVADKTIPENGKSESEIHYKKGLKLNLQNRNIKKINITLPKTKVEIYL